MHVKVTVCDEVTNNVLISGQFSRPVDGTAALYRAAVDRRTDVRTGIASGRRRVRAAPPSHDQFVDTERRNADFAGRAAAVLELRLDRISGAEFAETKEVQSWRND